MLAPPRSLGLFVALVTYVPLASLAAPLKNGDKTGWGEVIDPDRDCNVDFEKTFYTIEVPGKAHDFAAELMRWNSPRILTKSNGDFVARVKVSGKFEPSNTSTIPGRTPYNGAGLLVIADDHNYISLHRATLTSQGQHRHYLNFELRKDGQMAISNGRIDLEAGKDTFLELKREGDKFFARMSHDGEKWTNYEEPTEVEFPKALKVGVVAVNSSDQQFRCKMEDFRVTPLVPRKSE